MEERAERRGGRLDLPFALDKLVSFNQYSFRSAGLSRFVGLENYVNALANPKWWTAVYQTFIFPAFR